MLNRLDHVGIVVADLAEAKRFLGETLGLPLVREVDLSEQQGIVVAFYSLGNVNVEVIEVLDPEQRAKRLGPEGTRARIEHLATGVDDVAAAMQALQGLGVATTTPVPFELGGRMTGFTEADSSGGVQLQLVADRPR